MSKLTWPPEWNRVSTPTDPSKAAELMASSRLRYRCMIERLDKTKAAVSPHRLRSRVRTFLSSDTAKLGAFAVALAKRGQTPLSSEKALEAVSTGLGLSAWTYSGEAVLLKGMPKGHGDQVRPVYAFGPREYARQLLPASAARVTANLHPNQFTFWGGIPVFSAWLKENLGKAEVVITTDVPNHHLVLNRQRLIADRVLPTPVMSSILFEPMAKAKLKPPGSDGVLLSPLDFPPGVHWTRTS